MGVVTNLTHDEPVRLDAGPLVSLCCDLGQDGVDRVLRQVLNDLRTCLPEIARHAASGDEVALVQSARVIEWLAHRIGMVTLARVANDVARASRAGDATAVCATVARLARIGDRSLGTLRDIGRPAG